MLQKTLIVIASCCLMSSAFALTVTNTIHCEKTKQDPYFSLMQWTFANSDSGFASSKAEKPIVLTTAATCPGHNDNAQYANTRSVTIVNNMHLISIKNLRTNVTYAHDNLKAIGCDPSNVVTNDSLFEVLPGDGNQIACSSQ